MVSLGGRLGGVIRGGGWVVSLGEEAGWCHWGSQVVSLGRRLGGVIRE